MLSFSWLLTCSIGMEIAGLRRLDYISEKPDLKAEPNESRVFEILLASLPRADYLPKNARGRCARSVSYAHGFPERRRALPRQQPGVWRSRIKRAERCAGSLPRAPRTGFCLDGLRREWRGGNLRHLLCDLTSMGSIVAKLDDVSVKSDRRG